MVRYLFGAFFLAIFCGLIAETVAADVSTRRIVFLCAEQEYKTDITLPRFAKEYLANERVEFVYAKENNPNTLSSHLPILTADLLVVSVRRRALPVEQLAAIKEYVAAGKPVIGIRTASHAFSLRKGEPPVGHVVWSDFDQTVFGGNYTNHHSNDLVVTIEGVEVDSGMSRMLLDGVLPLGGAKSKGSLYKVSPIDQKTEILLTGKVPGYPAEPIAWTFIRNDGGKSFYTSLGHPADFESGVLPRLLLNAISWTLGGSE